ncbi:GDP-L-fucose synthase [Gordonia sp. LSe1-13]|uniref:GDP-L-fucose synthase n=1 Tax=Gordonia sesuvii TaxID=3116777 RepID=A0ABU7ME17_9ACTN|nr:GDP-L-fucose synthase [Gordonia sp. LSe1-13]
MSEITPIPKLDKDAPVYVAGHNGLVGSAIWRQLVDKRFSNLIGRSSAELDLTSRTLVFDFFQTYTPQVVVLAAAKVGGILANNTYPANFLSENLQIQTNVLDAAVEFKVPKLLFLGSSCIYPKYAEQPISEDSLMTGPLEPTNEAYALAKIAGIVHVQSVRRQYGYRWISAMPTNLYGPGDNFSLQNSHVLPALIRRYENAKRNDEPVVTNWGSGSPMREFLHVDDMANACLHLLENFDRDEQINVGTGVDHSIKEIAEMVADAVGYQGSTEWDTTKPDGTPRKLLNVKTLHDSGWKHSIELERGIDMTVAWFRENSGELRT